MFLIDDTKDSDATNTHEKTTTTVTPAPVDPEFVPSENCTTLMEQIKKINFTRQLIPKNKTNF